MDTAKSPLLADVYRWKRYDLYAQALGFGVPILFTFVLGEAFVFAYFIGGLTQVVSAYVHASYGSQPWKTKWRSGYVKMLSVVASLAAVGLVVIFTGVDSLALSAMLYYALLLLVTPFMAVWYAAICRNELALLKRILDERNSAKTTEEQ